MPIGIGKKKSQMSFTSTEPVDIKKGNWLEIKSTIPFNRWNWWKIRYAHKWWMRMIIKVLPIINKENKQKFVIHDCKITESDIEGMKTYEYIVTVKE
ncbi:MAG: hypothetical protein ACTSW7_01500 [Candidatus Thorarchaeota archaeon]|nr:hypothetical protein [Thermoplasmatales archaeon]